MELFIRAFFILLSKKPSASSTFLVRIGNKLDASPFLNYLLKRQQFCYRHFVISHLQIQAMKKHYTTYCYSTIVLLDSNLGFYVLSLTRPFALFAYYFCVARLS